MMLRALCVVAVLAGGAGGSGREGTAQPGLEEIGLDITGNTHGVEVVLTDARGRASGWAAGKRIDGNPSAVLNLNWDYTIPMDVGEPDTTLLKMAAADTVDDDSNHSTPPLVYEFRLVPDEGATGLPERGEFRMRMRGSANDSVSIHVSSRMSGGNECATDMEARLKDDGWRKWRLLWRVSQGKCGLDVRDLRGVGAGRKGWRK